VSPVKYELGLYISEDDILQIKLALLSQHNLDDMP
jgi:hypothetical protein